MAGSSSRRGLAGTRLAIGWSPTLKYFITHLFWSWQECLGYQRRRCHHKHFGEVYAEEFNLVREKWADIDWKLRLFLVLLDVAAQPWPGSRKSKLYQGTAPRAWSFFWLILMFLLCEIELPLSSGICHNRFTLTKEVVVPSHRNCSC